ncbi:MAG TPA: glycosyltransferase family 9 protein [Acidobacteriaceae bacterium]|nr:glycosyltransferase family 9 protein [Acidobacteriaceae bacterium]
MNEQLRVLIVRLGAMGDILHAMPAVTSLRERHPHWFLGWAVEPRWQALLRGSGSAMPLVNRVHLVKAKEWARAPFSSKTIEEIRSVRRDLQAERYDVCIDLQGAVRSAVLGRMAGAPRMIGEESPREPAARWLFRERRATQGVHVIEQAVEVCEAIAEEKLRPALPLLPVDPAAEEWADSLLNGGQRGAAKGLVLMNPGAGWGAKRWPAERYGAVGRKLCAAGYRVMINAGPEEQAIAAEAAEIMGGAGRVQELVPEFTLDRLISILRRASLMIAGDTGPLHLACALGKPVVGIFGPTEPKRNGPFGVPFRVLRHPESKRDHTRRAHPEAGLLTITADEVYLAAIELLEKQA